MDRLPRPPESFFEGTPPHVRAYIEQLHAVIDHLSSVIEKHEARIAELEARLGQTSRNSSQPPSSDGPHVKPAPPRPPSGRKRGGQPGHAKRERTILPPDEVHDYKPLQCQHCDTALTGDDPDPVIDQVLELPVKLRHVVHHRRHTLTCPCCQTATTASPVPDAASGFGPRVQATVAYLAGVGRLGKRAIRQFFADLCDIPLSLGMVSKLERKTSVALAPLHAEALAATQGQHANIDETGWKQGAKRAWLWVARTATAFLIRPTRGRVAFHDLRPNAAGILTTDRYPVYDHLPVARRQLCWAHLRRDFQAMIDRDDAGAKIGEDLLLNADVLFKQWNRVRDGTLTRDGFRRTYGWLRDEVHATLVRGTACGSAKTQTVCEGLLPIEAALWTFTHHDGIEPTNNAAERALRHAVCWRKTSYGTDSEPGSRFVERILTVAATARQHGLAVLAQITDAIHAVRMGTQRPSRIACGV